MERIDKTVFLSYRRTNIPWALAIFQNLTQHGYDVFFDYNGLASGDFERVILANIHSRAHFLVLLTPSALERCADPQDWLRREIETAVASQRNVVPLMLEGFDFGSMGDSLRGELSALKNYNGLRIPPDYFEEAMERLRTRFLNIPLTAVLHPAPISAVQAAMEQKDAANAAPAVQEAELTAQQWFERGLAAVSPEDKIQDYSEVIRLFPDHAEAYRNRGIVRHSQGDLEGALEDYNRAITLKGNDFHAFHNRGVIRDKLGDRDAAQQDYDKAQRLKLDQARPLMLKGIESRRAAQFDRSLRELNEAIRLNPDYAEAYFHRGKTRREQGDTERELRDYNEAIRLKPDLVDAYYSRAGALVEKSLYRAAVADYEKYLALGGGSQNGNEGKVQKEIARLKERL